ncbi:hypothetical protein PAHAL_5G110000 [Panicum hallii]|uniref:Uncharacterized protein n=1 Tax=Panicum hallii TaxID=206008 RepID=A0A2T8IJM4_9POAL|nr:hypothetical protein PAHAL_5G110000 [Panicum hallii]
MPFIASILHVYTATVVYSSYHTIQSKEESTPAHSRNNRQRPRISCLSSV